ncbi:Uncharacterised protein [Mycobacterium tuberculosis]|nr:Uncharacterised protein [Mycobacterium tuberculosis]
MPRSWSHTSSSRMRSSRGLRGLGRIGGRAITAGGGVRGWSNSPRVSFATSARNQSIDRFPGSHLP